MKVKITNTIIATFFVINVFAQAYIPFIKEGKLWSEFQHTDPFYPLHQHAIHYYEMNGDTLINSTTYKKVYKDHYLLNCIKEDTTDKKVYLYNDINQSDSLIYDFNLQLNDTFYGSNNGVVCSYIVTDKSNVFYASKNRTRILFTGDYNSIIWYEGIGSVNYTGVFETPCFSLDEWECYLLCYFENNTLLYHNSAFNDSCFVITQAKELQPENPFNSYYFDKILNIFSTSPNTYSLSVIDIFGRKIKEIITNGNLIINLSELPNGLYLYMIESEIVKNKYVNKILINK